MAEGGLIIKNEYAQMDIGEFDEDKEARIMIHENNLNTACIYLNRDNLCSIKQHIEYLLAKT